MVDRSPGVNVVMLETNELATCLLHQTVIHELMHTIGLWHEQMRYDRDKYIHVHYENISPCMLLLQFGKCKEHEFSDQTTFDFTDNNFRLKFEKHRFNVDFACPQMFI